MEESDAASLRAHHCRQAQTIAARMSRTTLQEARGRELDSSSQPSTSRRSGSRVQNSAPEFSAQWFVMSEAPASPAPVRLRAPLRSPSPCLSLDILSSDG